MEQVALVFGFGLMYHLLQLDAGGQSYCSLRWGCCVGPGWIIENKRISNHETSWVPRGAARHNAIRASPMTKSKLEESRNLGRHAALKHFER